MLNFKSLFAYCGIGNLFADSVTVCFSGTGWLEWPAAEVPSRCGELLDVEFIVNDSGGYFNF